MDLLLGISFECTVGLEDLPQIWLVGGFYGCKSFYLISFLSNNSLTSHFSHLESSEMVNDH